MKLTCEAVERQMDLFLYGEMSFADEERIQQHLESCARCQSLLASARSWHQALEVYEPPVPEGLLVSARRGLRQRLAAEPAMPRSSFWSVMAESMRAPAWLKPAGALAMVAAAFLAGRYTPARETPAAPETVPAATRVRFVEPAADGSIQIALDETRQRIVSGRLDEPRIKALLIAAAKDPTDPSLRVDSVEMLCSRSQEGEVRDALIYVLEHDANSGVRLKAIEGLKSYGKDQRTRQALTRVLLHDASPGVRAQAIDVLMQVRSQDMVAPLQEALRTEDDGYVRLRTQRILEAMNASPGIF